MVVQLVVYFFVYCYFVFGCKCLVGVKFVLVFYDMKFGNYGFGNVGVYCMVVILLIYLS